MNLYSDLFYSKKVNELCDEASVISYMIRFEVALARAQEALGVIPEGSAQAIATFSDPGKVNVGLLKEKMALTGNAAAPLVKQLTEIVKQQAPEAAKYIHFGGTSQDVIDTALVLQLKDFFNWLELQLSSLEKSLAQLTSKHRETIMIGRTLMQQAQPITFGLKTAAWLVSIRRSHQRIQEAKKRILCVQLGGAVGSQNDQIPRAVREKVAQILELNDTPSWHSQRDGIAEAASILGILCGSLGKIAKDIILMAQTEVGEVYEPAAKGRGTSSTMPHKRNPVLSTIILSNAQRTPHLVATILSAIPQEHERAAGLWHAEWETLSDILKLTGGAVEKTIELIAGLEVDAHRMRQNLEQTQGLIYAESVALALANIMGKKEAHHWVENACQIALKEQKQLKVVLTEMEIALTPSQLDALFDPQNATGQSLEIIDEILKAYEDPL